MGCTAEEFDINELEWKFFKAMSKAHVYYIFFPFLNKSVQIMLF